MINVETFNFGISSLVILGQLLVVVLVLLLIFSKITKKKLVVLDWFSKNAFQLSLIVALTSLFGSLYYSEIVGYEPCKLCWLQRIFIYPQVLILIIALYLKDNKAVHYILWMSLFALGIASYHYLGQLGFTSLECGLVGYSVSCAERFVMNFGYITIPMMALTAMVMNIVFSIVKLTNKK